MLPPSWARTAAPSSCPAALSWHTDASVMANFLQLQQLPPGCLFDLVLASHILYQMPRDVTAAMLLKMRAHCAPGGRILVALAAPRGLMCCFEQELLPSTVTSQTILGVLEELALPYSVTPLNDRRNFVASEAHLHLVLRFLAEEASEGAAQQAAVISKCVAEWPRWQDGGFPLHQDSDCILIG